MKMWLNIIALLEQQAWLVIFAKMKADQQSFAARVLSRVCLPSCLLLLYLPEPVLDLPYDDNTVGRLVTFGFVQPATLVSMTLGPAQVCRVPVVGALLIR